MTRRNNSTLKMLTARGSRRGNASSNASSQPRGFTLIETLVGLTVLVLILSIVIVSVSRARKSAKAAVQAQSLASLKTAVSTFIQNFNFPPPLCKDMSKYPAAPRPTDIYAFMAGGENKLAVYDSTVPKDVDFLRRKDAPALPSNWGKTDGNLGKYYDPRFSTASLTFYLVGVADKKITAGNTDTPVDGKVGPGFLRPRADGTFEVPESAKVKPSAGGGSNTSNRTGDSFGPFIDTDKGQLKMVRTGDRYELMDDKGVPYRYYRWEKGNATTGTVTTFSEQNIPWLLVQVLTPEAYRSFNADDAKRKEPECATRMIGLNSATYAVMSAGPNGLFGDEPIIEIQSKLSGVSGLADEEVVRRRAYEDNVVEVGS